MSLIDPGWADGELKTEHGTWQHVSYRCLGRRLVEAFADCDAAAAAGEDAPTEVGFAREVVARHGGLMVELANLMDLVAAVDLAEPLAVSGEVHELLQRARIADAVGKARAHRAMSLIRERLDDRGVPAPAQRTCRIAIAYGPGDGTAGPSYWPVVFTNTGQQPCQLTGGAHAEFLTPDGTGVVGDSTAIEGGLGVLGPGASITSTMRSTSTGKFDEERCGAVPVSGLRITPPADAEPTTLPSTVGDTVCNGIIRGQISFTPLPTGP